MEPEIELSQKTWSKSVTLCLPTGWLWSDLPAHDTMRIDMIIDTMREWNVINVTVFIFLNPIKSGPIPSMDIVADLSKIHSSALSS